MAFRPPRIPGLDCIFYCVDRSSPGFILVPVRLSCYTFVVWISIILTDRYIWLLYKNLTT